MTSQTLRIVKGHAYGNDFLYVCRDAMERLQLDASHVARVACHRQTGIGADGLIVFERTAEGAAMRLFNADGSAAEVSGNGVRVLGALIAREGKLASRAAAGLLAIDTVAGRKWLTLLDEQGGNRFLFRSDMGAPGDLRQETIDVAGETLDIVALSMGNPQCVVFGDLDAARLARIGPALQRAPVFPGGVNVELASIEARDRVRILIWERGVGPTLSSGTGSCAAAVAAAAFRHADRAMDVVAPGGTQRVEWADAHVFLTGWATLVLDGEWLLPARAAEDGVVRANPAR